MSVPFSNTHLRVPRGFGSILELLAKEVLRDQPQDIPSFAALYFEGLLKQREESGMDSAEWAARLEDRFYNNHSFKSSRGLSPTKVQPATASLNSISSEEKIESSEAKNSPAVGGESSKLSESEGSDEKEDETNKDVIPASPALSQERAGRGLPDTGDSSDEGRRWTEEGEEEAADPDQGRATDGDGDPSEPEPYEPASLSRAADWDEGSGGLRMTGEVAEEPDLGWEEAPSEEEEEEWAELQGEAELAGLAGVDVCAEELGEAARQPAGGASERGFRHVLKDEEEISAAHVSSEPLLEEGRRPFSPGQPSSSEANLQEVMRQSDTVQEEEQGETQTDSRATPESVSTAGDTHHHPNETADKDAKGLAPNSPEEGSEVCDGNQTLEEDLGEILAPEDVTEDTTGPQQMAAPDQGDGHLQSQDEAMEPIAEPEAVAEHPVQAGDADTAGPLDAILTDTERHMDDDTDGCEGEGDRMTADESVHLMYATETAGKEEGGADDHNEGRSESTGELESHQETAAGTENRLGADREYAPTGGEDVGRKGTDVSHPLDVPEKETTDRADGEEDEEKAGEEGEEKEIDAQKITGLDLSETEDEAGGERDGEEVGEDRLPGEEGGRGEGRVEGTGVEGIGEEGTGEEGEEERREEERREEDTMELQASDTPAQVHTEDGKMESEEQDNLSTVGDLVTVPSSQGTGSVEEEHQEPKLLGDAVQKEDVEAEASQKEPCSAPQEEEDIMDIPLDDPEANKAAAKIQAGFRGHMTRKKMKPEDEKAGEEVSSSGEALNGSQGDTEPGGSGGVELGDTSVPEQ